LSDLTQDEIEKRAIARRMGEAIGEQHPGVQISERVEGDLAVLEMTHPAHSWAGSLGLTHPNPANGARLMAMRHYLHRWQDALTAAVMSTQCTNAMGENMEPEQGLLGVIDLMRKVQGSGRKFIFVGNGGSAAIASHMAEDFTKNGKVRAVTFNDAALMSCFANDYGWWNVFLEAVRKYGDPGDVLVCISSSGNSANIMAAATEAKALGVVPITLSGFTPDNKLRAMGTLNFYTPASQFGFVETAHAAILHAILDIHMGWVGQK